MESVKDRIITFIQKNKLSVRRFEQAANLSNGAVAKMGNSPRMFIIENILSAFPDINREWLISGEGDMYMPKEDLPQVSYTEGVPYYDEDFMLGFEEVGTPNSENPDFLIRMPGYERATLWCNASGHSMEPEINSGDIIALQRIEDFSFLPYGDVYGIITTNGMRTIKRLGRGSTPDTYRLIPTNRDYDEQEIKKSQIAMVYRVMGAMKGF